MSTTHPQDDDFDANNAVERLARAAHQAIDRAAARAETLGEQHEQWLEAAGNHVREHPLTSILLAVAAGALIDRMLR